MKRSVFIDLLDQLSAAGQQACWRWPRYVGPEGYGQLKLDDRIMQAHRAAYLVSRGSIGSGMTVDHLCHSRDGRCSDGQSCQHRACVNPAHMELVTPEENSHRQWKARKTHCVNGHAFTAANTYFRPRGGRQCRACMAAQQRAYQQRKKKVA